MRRYSFSKREHLKNNKSIKRVLDEGTPVRTRFFTVFLLKRETFPHIKRVTFTIRKNLYNKKPVLRNRFRRLLKESYRRTCHFLSGCYDIVIVGTDIKKHIKSTIIEKDLANVFKRYNKK